MAKVGAPALVGLAFLAEILLAGAGTAQVGGDLVQGNTHFTALGLHGGISVIANALPRHFSGMVNAALASDFPRARKLNFDMLDIHPPLYVEGNPVGIKAAVSMLGLCHNHLRVPLMPLSEPHREKLRKLLSLVPDLTL